MQILMVALGIAGLGEFGIKHIKCVTVQAKRWNTSFWDADFRRSEINVYQHPIQV